MYRPILDLPKTKREKIWDWIGGGIFIGSMLYIIAVWGKIPDEVPGHFNAAGEVDRWGSKFELIILPFIGVFLWILMGLLEKAPHMHNYSARLNENNVEALYLNSRKILNEVKNCCLILFAIISFQMVRIALGDAQSLGWWFLPLVIIGTAFPIIKGVVMSSKIK
ncbi:DUF1648 domain-containing protein [Lysinibacillus sp. NPDC096418]|uniref:DUF1648 domain-containing protein n=1 Tax=Lysinibacillus sp. NPDC096418 TaxID=3364138 RepID=UPI00382FFB05